MVRDSDADSDEVIEDSRSAASILQSKQLISTNVITKRKEQLNRWEKSEMNGEMPHRSKRPRVHFQDSDIFLSACMSGDEDEVEELLAKGADINTATVDGLTALHQSVIDSKPEMVQFLCKHGANVNAQDNEGWTPLHAAACCGNVCIVQMLCETGASLATINSDKELPVDLAEDEACRVYLENQYSSRGIDVETARDAELDLMLKDVRDGRSNVVHPKTGATPLHVAAAKGYTQVLELLLKGGVDVHSADNDGWTALHGAAHWGEKDACKMLMDAGASLDTTNFAGQNVLSVADKDVVEFLEFEKAEAESMLLSKESSPHSPSPATVLAEKNPRVPAHAVHSHLSTEQKHALSVADEKSENEALHPSKVPRLAIPAAMDVKSPSPSEEETPSRPAPSTPKEIVAPLVPAPVPPIRSTAAHQNSRESSVTSTASSLSASTSSSITPTDRSTPSQSISNAVIKNIPQQESSSTQSVISSGDATVQFTVPLRSWTRPAPLTSSSRSTSASTASITSASTSTSSPSVSSPLSVKPPLGLSLSSASSSQLSPIRENLASSTSNLSSSSSVTLRSVPLSPRPRPVSALPLDSSSRVEATPRSGATVSRSASSVTPSTLPWNVLLSSGGSLAHSRVSAFRPISGSHSSLSSMAAPPPSLIPVHRSAILPQPGPLPAHVMRPWQSATVASQESEAERRQTARMQRQHRRSTQGVTKEQLEEATRLAAEESARRRNSQNSAASSTPSGPCRLASEEKDSSTERSLPPSIPSSVAPSVPRISAEVVRLSDRSSSDRYSDSSRASPPSGTLSIAVLPPSATPSANNIRKKNQALGGFARPNRRSTGPVAVEDVLAAAEKEREEAKATAAPSAPSAPPPVAPPRSTLSQWGRPANGEKTATVTPSTPSSTSSIASTPSRPAASSAVATNNGNSGLATGRVAPRVVPSSNGPPSSAPESRTSQFAAPTIASAAAATANYKMLYEKERGENDKLRRELEESRRAHEAAQNGASSSTSNVRRVTGISRLSSSASTGLSKSPSANSMEDAERRTLERKIAELELELKTLGQLRLENQRLKEENGALVRVISKMTI